MSCPKFSLPHAYFEKIEGGTRGINEIVLPQSPTCYPNSERDEGNVNLSQCTIAKHKTEINGRRRIQRRLNISW